MVALKLESKNQCIPAGIVTLTSLMASTTPDALHALHRSW